MFEHSNSFVPLGIVIPTLILAIFAMKYSVQMLRARAEAATTTDATHRLASLEKTAGDVEHRVAHLETMLKEVE